MDRQFWNRWNNNSSIAEPNDADTDFTTSLSVSNYDIKINILNIKIHIQNINTRIVNYIVTSYSLTYINSIHSVQNLYIYNILMKIYTKLNFGNKKSIFL